MAKKSDTVCLHLLNCGIWQPLGTALKACRQYWLSRQTVQLWEAVALSNILRHRDTFSIPHRAMGLWLALPSLEREPLFSNSLWYETSLATFHCHNSALHKICPTRQSYKGLVWLWWIVKQLIIWSEVTAKVYIKWLSSNKPTLMMCTRLSKALTPCSRLTET